jgi:LPXTG-site transpeptidase (sortase) family protein
MLSKKPAPQNLQEKLPFKEYSTLRLIRDKVIGLILLTLALFLLLIPLHKSQSANKNPIKIDAKLQNSKAVENIPVRIILPKSDIDLSVVPAKIVDGFWETSETDASYGLGSGLPGTRSNTVIFAHAREGLFYNLKYVKSGDSIYVLSKNKWYKYSVNKITAVYPDQKEVILPTKNETLTLYTCTGFNDEKRLIVTAAPKK